MVSVVQREALQQLCVPDGQRGDHSRVVARALHAPVGTAPVGDARIGSRPPAPRLDEAGDARLAQDERGTAVPVRKAGELDVKVDHPEGLAAGHLGRAAAAVASSTDGPEGGKEGTKGHPRQLGPETVRSLPIYKRATMTTSARGLFSRNSFRGPHWLSSLSHQPR